MSARARGDSVGLAWLGVIALGVMGYAAIVAPSEREVHATAIESSNVYELAERNERMLQRGSAIAAAATRVRRDLSELRGKAGAGKPALELLSFLDAESRRQHVSFGGIVPSERDAPASGMQRVSLTLEGAYDDVLQVVSDLTTQRAIVGVESVQLSRASHVEGEESAIDASVSTTLFYGARPFERAVDREEPTRVRTIER